MAGGEDRRLHESTSRRMRRVSAQEVVEATAAHHWIDASDYAAFRSSAAGREMAAWLCCRWTGAALAQLGPRFGLCGTNSVSNLVRRAQRRHDESIRWRQRATEIEKTLGLKTEQKVRPRRSPSAAKIGNDHEIEQALAEVLEEVRQRINNNVQLV